MDRLDTPDADWSLEETARHMATQICLGFKYHDRRDRDGALEAFTVVDDLQFAHIDSEESRAASEALVDALWRKDDLEIDHTEGGQIDREGLEAADWNPVESAFRRRAAIVGIDPRYAEASTEAWCNHKVRRDYRTPIQRAQMYELRAALQDPDYPHKPRFGQSGYGPEPARYALAVELHDMHTQRHWDQARRVMVPYYERILRDR